MGASGLEQSNRTCVPHSHVKPMTAVSLTLRTLSFLPVQAQNSTHGIRPLACRGTYLLIPSVCLGQNATIRGIERCGFLAGLQWKESRRSRIVGFSVRSISLVRYHAVTIRRSRSSCKRSLIRPQSTFQTLPNPAISLDRSRFEDKLIPLSRYPSLSLSRWCD